MTTRLRPPGFGAPSRPRPLGDGPRLRRDRSLLADAQRRYNAVADDDAASQASAPIPDPSPQRALRAGGGERAVLGVKDESRNDAALTPLTHEARALYEGRVVPVRALARLCGASLRTLYYHVHKQGWRRRRSDVPRDPAKSERQKRRYRELKALRPAAPRGLQARDPVGQARALALAERATALSGAALARALARQETEAKARILAIMTQALRDLRAANEVKSKRTRGKDRKARRRPYQWRAIGEPPAWAERER